MKVRNKYVIRPRISKFKTPWELIQQCYNEDRERFREDPNHKIVGLNI